MATRSSSSAGTSTEAPDGGRGTARSYSGQGRTINNLVFLAACMAIMIGSFWAFANYPNSPLVWIVGLLLYTLALLIPVGLLHSSTAKRAEGGRTVAMDVPPTTEVGGVVRTAENFDDGPRNPEVRDAQVRAEHGDDKYGHATQ